MDIISIVADTISIGCLILGFYILIQDIKNTKNRLFFLISFCIAAWNICTIFGYHLKTREGIEICLKIAACFIIPFFALAFHLCFIITQKRKMKFPEMLLNYLPAVLILSVIFIKYSLMFDYHQINGRWQFMPSYNSVFFYFLAFYTTGIGITSIILLFIYGKNAVLKKEKKQAFWMTMTVLLTTAAGSASRFFLPYFHINQLPDIGATFFIVFILGLYHSVFRYKFMVVKPSIVADEIISNISDMVLLLNTEFKILSVNKKSAELLSLKNNDLYNKPFLEIALMDAVHQADLEKLLHRNISHFNARISYKNQHELILTDSYISAVKDEFLDLIGILVISKENKGKKQFQGAFRITDREYEIIELSLSGLSGREIGNKLGISERTVETHYSHIYNKIGINNKIELMNIAHDFNLLPGKY